MLSRSIPGTNLAAEGDGGVIASDLVDLANVMRSCNVWIIAN
jgi:hypothetical protein